MINLLSSHEKQMLKAAHRNVILRKYVLTLLSLAILVAGSYGVGYALLISQENSYKQQLSQYQPQKLQYSDTLKQAKDYSYNLTVAKSILDNEIVFSDFAILVAKTTPQNVRLSSLNIKAKDVAKPLELNFAAKSYNEAVLAKNQFEASPYFSNVQIRTINKLTEGTHPYQVVLIMTFDQSAFNTARKAGAL